MIPRYEHQDIARLWTEENRFREFLNVEVAVLKALEAKNKIPKNTHQAFTNVEIRPKRIAEIEATTRHDVIAFCTSITEQVAPELARFFHFGVTSSDILDTALSLQLKASVAILVRELEALINALETKVEETKDLLTVGRSHGMYAEPMIFAQKFLSFKTELKRRLFDYQHVMSVELTGQLSGAVGNYTVLDPEIEKLALAELGLPVETVSSQVLPRDHLGLVVSIGALLASALERMAVEFRLLHHSDVNELHEGFAKGQKGSSTMPHKKNPISAENITGLSRVIRSHVDIALENCVLWHERDISHSSTERLYLPDHFGLLAYATKRMTSTVQNLELHREEIEKKALSSFASLSSYILHEMILLNATTREELYAFVQEVSFKAKTADEFFALIDASAKAKGHKVPAITSVAQLKQHYVSRFAQVRERTKA